MFFSASKKRLFQGKYRKVIWEIASREIGTNHLWANWPQCHLYICIKYAAIRSALQQFNAERQWKNEKKSIPVFDFQKSFFAFRRKLESALQDI